MTVRSSVFHPHAFTLANADAEGLEDGPAANDPTIDNHRIGFVAKADGKASSFIRFDMDRPFSGPNIATDGRLVVVRAKFVFKIHTTIIIDGPLAFTNIGILFPVGNFMSAALGFGATAYATLDDLPRATNSDDVIILNRLYNEKFLSRAGDSRIGFLITTAVAGYTVTIGEGFPIGGLNPPIFDSLADHYDNFASELTTYFRRANFITPGAVQRTLGFTFDTQDNPPGIDEHYRIFASDDSVEPGVVLTIEWEDNQTTVSTFGLEAGPIVSNEGLTADPVVLNQGMRAGPVVSDEGLKAGPIVSNKGLEAGPIVTSKLEIEE